MRGLGKAGMISAALAAAPATAMGAAGPEAAEITVTATPLYDVGEDVLAAPAQGATDEDLAATHALDATDWLRRIAGGVAVNDISGNPLQADLNFRGFTASPLLGTPQGLSVWIDGVRINQPFGDVVSWDLIPKAAIRSMNLVPGANPLFGRNALGGALSVRTKDGRSDPGVRLTAGLGRFARRIAEAEAGGSTAGGVHWFAAGNWLAEDGWRDVSASEAVQGFGKLGWKHDGGDLWLSVTGADTDLNGNGLQELRLLQARRAGVYTHPDTTRNRALAFNLVGTQRLGAALALDGNLFWRRIRTRTLNGDASDAAIGSAEVYGPGETAVNTPFPAAACLAEAAANREPQEACNGLLNRSATRQREWGGSVELSHRTALAGGENRVTVGLSWVDGRADFGQSSEFGVLTPDRGVTGTGVFADGSQDGDQADDARVDLGARTRVLSAYLLEAVDLTRRLHVDLSARFDRTRIRNRDRINPGGGTGSLDGDHDYHRLNPAVALRWRAATGVTLDAALAQTSRVPSAIELGCADPESPCRLPNALAGDPPLRQVIARTVDAGARWDVAPRAFLRVGAWQTVARDDILFVASPRTGFGYFRNFGATRRRGIDVDAGWQAGRMTLAAHYSLLDARYRSAETVGGTGNSSNNAGPGLEGTIAIAPGNRIPLLPRHLFKASATWDAAAWLAVNADLVAQSGVIARGNENGGHRPDGIDYLGPGHTRGFALVNLGGELRPSATLAVIVQVDNLFDVRASNAAQLGATAFDAEGHFDGLQAGVERSRGSTFLGPVAPRQWRVAVRARF